MGWYSCYTALKVNDCETANELFKKNEYAYLQADRTNVPNCKTEAWQIAEKKVLEDKNDEIKHN